MLKPFFFALFCLLLLLYSPAQVPDTASEKTTEQLIKENEDLIRRNQSYEDSMARIQADANGRTFSELVKVYEKKQRAKQLQKAILYIVIGLAMAVFLVMNLRRRMRK